MTMRNDISREYYYKAKASPLISRGVNGLIDETYFKSIDGCPIAVRHFIDLVRRVPEDQLSMSDCADRRAMDEIRRSKTDYYAHNRENMAYRAYYLVDSRQCRGMT